MQFIDSYLLSKRYPRPHQDVSRPACERFTYLYEMPLRFPKVRGRAGRHDRQTSRAHTRSPFPGRPPPAIPPCHIYALLFPPSRCAAYAIPVSAIPRVPAGSLTSIIPKWSIMDENAPFPRCGTYTRSPFPAGPPTARGRSEPRLALQDLRLRDLRLDDDLDRLAALLHQNGFLQLGHRERVRDERL